MCMYKIILFDSLVHGITIVWGSKTRGFGGYPMNPTP